MVQARGRPRFLHEPLPGLGVSCQLSRQELERYRSLELPVFGPIDCTHPSLTQLGSDVIVGNRLTNHGKGAPRNSHATPRPQASQREGPTPASSCGAADWDYQPSPTVFPGLG